MSGDRDERMQPGRSMRLLWALDIGPSRGPRQRLSVDDIVTAAIDLADEEGLDAVSMRRLADRLGVGAMTLYTYVEAKSDLHDLMYDRVVGASLRRTEEAQKGTGWRERLEALARDQWDLHQRHHWLGQLPWTRTPLGPNILDAYEQALSVVDGLGLTGQEMNLILTLISAYVNGAARTAVEAATLPATTSVDDTSWWEAVSPVLEEVWDIDRFPTLSSPVMERAWEQDDEEQGYFLAEAAASFEFGLARVLDGIESYVADRTAG